MIQTLLPISDVSSSGIVSYSSGSTAWPLLQDDDAVNKILFAFGDGFIRCGIQKLASALSIASVTVRCHDLGGGGGADTYSNATLILRMGGVDYPLAVGPTGSGRAHAFKLTGNPANGEPWNVVSVNSIEEIGLALTGYITADSQPTNLVLDVDKLDAPATVDISRNVASLAIFELRDAKRFIKFVGHLDVLGTDAQRTELCYPAQLAHIDGPHPIDDGWGNKPWQLRPVSPQSITENPNDYTVEMDLLDMRERRALVWYPAWSTRNSGVLEDGIPRMLNPSAIFHYTRAGNETIVDPLGDTVTNGPNVPGYTAHGLAMLAGSGARCWISANFGNSVWSVRQGAFRCEIYLLGPLAEDRVIAYSRQNATNYAKLWYDNASGKIKFSITRSGVTTTITAPATISAATAIEVSGYWTGLNLENDLPAYTMVLYVNRVLQATGVAPGAMTEFATSTLDFGSEAGSNILRGYMRKIISLQYVPTSTEMEQPL